MPAHQFNIDPKTPYIKKYRPLIAALGRDAADLLCELIDKATLIELRHPANGGWFFYPMRMQKISTGMTEYALGKAKKCLTDRGLLITEQREKEYFLLDFRRIQRVLTDGFTPDGSSAGTPDGSSAPLLNKSEHNSQNIRLSTKADRSQPDGRKPGNGKRNWMVSGAKSKILEAWNNLDGPTTHKDRSTKSMKLADELVQSLLDGTFLRLRTLSKDFTKRHRIPSERIYNKKLKYTQQQIIQAIQAFELMWRPDRWPQNKGTLPKALPDFFHNRMKGTSFFFMVYYNPDVFKPVQDNDRSSLYNPLFKFISNYRGANPGEVNRYLEKCSMWLRNTYDLKDTHTRYNLAGNYKEAKPEFWKFFSKYANYLDSGFKTEYLVENLDDVFMSWGRVFKEFMAEYGESFKRKNETKVIVRKKRIRVRQ